MAGRKPGHPKTGGRVKGTPNKTSASLKQMIVDILTEYSSSGRMSRDFDALDPKDRLAVAEKLMQYNMPKIQSVEVDVATVREKTIEDRLKELAEE